MIANSSKTNSWKANREFLIITVLHLYYVNQTCTKTQTTATKPMTQLQQLSTYVYYAAIYPPNSKTIILKWTPNIISATNTSVYI